MTSPTLIPDQSIVLKQLACLDFEQLNQLPKFLFQQSNTWIANYDHKMVVVTSEYPRGIQTRRCIKGVKKCFSISPQVVQCSEIELLTVKNRTSLKQKKDINQIELSFNEPKKAMESNASRQLAQLLDFALIRDISDIHLEYRTTKPLAKVRVRQHGLLAEIEYPLKKAEAYSLVNYLFNQGRKENGTWQPDVAQDASFDYQSRDSKSIQVRLSTLPEVQGWDLMMRLFFMHKKIPSINELGYTKAQVDELNLMKERDSGVIIFCGPTGSGKSTSMLSMVQNIDPSQKVISLEQPVERFLGSVSQVSSSDEQQMQQLSSALNRWDADVAILGEVRDEKSAKSLENFVSSGKLTFFTLHTASSLAVPMRLEILGMRRDIITASWFLNGIVYQRVIPLLCTNCKVSLSQALPHLNHAVQDYLKKHVPSEQMHSMATSASIIQTGGCDKQCHQGYQGRTIVCEVVTAKNSDQTAYFEPQTWRALLKERNWQTIGDMTLRKSLRGEVDTVKHLGFMYHEIAELSL